MEAARSKALRAGAPVSFGDVCIFRSASGWCAAVGGAAALGGYANPEQPSARGPRFRDIRPEAEGLFVTLSFRFRA